MPVVTGPNLVAGELSAFDEGDGWVWDSPRSCGGRDRIWELAPLCGCCIPASGQKRPAGYFGYEP
ncbi:hypothetical protein [Dactylosporangium salmoneum]|uniref:Uncharacterized protein n=1 Tax=Dactylosporangium salmoneum TaxID=53361 RepID=A0ABN3HE59_9ACTN